MRGGRVWSAYPALSRPLTIAGVDRRWFVLSATIGLAMWNAINSLITGGTIFLVLYGTGWIAWKKDPAMLVILKAASRYKTRYDPAKWGASPWHIRLRS